MPGKKKAAQKPAAKKTPTKKAAKKSDKKAVKKVAPAKKPAPKKAVPHQAVPQRVIEPAPMRAPAPIQEQVEEHQEDTTGMVECDHCLGAGKCTAGEPYDKGHHHVFGAKLILTSCFDCLEAAGEHRNSKKLVACRICGGRGLVKM
jgi:hypothetical protein